LFTEQKEIVTRQFIHRLWLFIERSFVPKFKCGYTVNDFIAEEFYRRYKVKYTVIRNLPLLYPLQQIQSAEKYILYQGAVNEGRCFETLIPAMHHLNAKLMICGKGNFFEQVKQMMNEYQLDSKIELKGYILPAELKKITNQATIGITLFEPTGLNQYHSLSNRFFDYIMAAVPQVCVNFPEYKKINDQQEIALLIDHPSVTEIANALNHLLNNDVLRSQLHNNCLAARQKFNWQTEEKILVDFWNERSIWRNS
jgi:glycosyltransferase involved in cell wall biosynthesis